MTGLYGTTADWTPSEYDDTAGYDCMTGGIRIGTHITLDAGDYGQAWSGDKRRNKFDPVRMEADARALSQLPAMLVLVDAVADWVNIEDVRDMARAIVKELEKK